VLSRQYWGEREKSLLPAFNLAFSWDKLNDTSISVEESSRHDPLVKGGDSISTLRYQSRIDTTFKLIKALTDQVVTLEDENMRRGESLGRVIKGLRKDVQELKEERAKDQLYKELRDYSSTPEPYSLTTSDCAGIATKLKDPIPMAFYVMHPELAAQDYATRDYVDNLVSSIPSFPLRLTERLSDLEAAVMTSSCAIDQLKARLKSIEDRQIVKAVTICGYTFKDVVVVQALVNVLGDDEIHRYAFDMKA